MNRSNKHVTAGLIFIAASVVVALAIYLGIKLGLSATSQLPSNAKPMVVVATQSGQPSIADANSVGLAAGSIGQSTDLASGVSSSYYNPSFDCGGRLTNVLRTICYSDSLSMKDRELSDRFKAILAQKSGEDRQNLLNSQRAFLADREQCQDQRCLNDWYDTIIAHYKYETIESSRQ